MAPRDDDEVVVGRILDVADRFADLSDDDLVGFGDVVRVGELGPVVDDRDAEIEKLPSRATALPTCPAPAMMSRGRGLTGSTNVSPPFPS